MDYQEALKTYYRQGPSQDWADHTVTAYASSHPLEDWAESWAHYLHIYDTLETADAFGLGMSGQNLRRLPECVDFDAIFERWVPLVCALNSINRGMGLLDLYPFVIPEPAVEKLRFIHELVLASGASSSTRPPEDHFVGDKTAATASSNAETLTGLMR